jgi:hypothetical protein
LAAAVEKGLPRSALVRVVERAGLTGKARDALMYRVVPLAELLWDDRPAAQRFLNTPHPELAGRTPLESKGSELGARQVEDIVNRALYGLPVWRARSREAVPDRRPPLQTRKRGGRAALWGPMEFPWARRDLRLHHFCVMFEVPEAVPPAAKCVDQSRPSQLSAHSNRERRVGAVGRSAVYTLTPMIRNKIWADRASHLRASDSMWLGAQFRRHLGGSACW